MPTADKEKNKLALLGTIVFALTMALVLFTMVFVNANSFYTIQPVVRLLLVFAAALAVYLAWWLVRKLPLQKRGVEWGAALLLFALLLTAQIVVVHMLRVYPNMDWDFGIVYNYARNYVLEGVSGSADYAHGTDYFVLFQNNRGLYFFWCMLFSAMARLGSLNFELGALVANVLAINLSVFLLYFCLRRFWGGHKALFALCFCLASLPFTLYAPIFYTDTLTMPFPIAVFYLWLHIREKYSQGKFRLAAGLSCLLAAVAAAGAILKISVLIMAIGAVLGMAAFRGAKKWLLVAAAVLVCAALMLGYSAFASHSPLLAQQDSDKSIPFTHWVMMGLNGYGDYHDEDYQLTLTAPTLAGRYALTLNEIARRVGEKGFFGMVGHLGRKLGFIFGDGTYWAVEKLSRYPVHNTYLHAFVLPTGSNIAYVVYAGFFVQAGLMFLCLAGVLGERPSRRNLLWVGRIALVGLVVFLLLWEARSRYLVNYLPVFVAVAVAPLRAGGPVFRLRQAWRKKQWGPALRQREKS